MPSLHELTATQKEDLCREVMQLFCCLPKGTGQDLYPYQRRVAWAILHRLLVTRTDVFVKIARQSGKSKSCPWSSSPDVFICTS